MLQPHARAFLVGTCLLASMGCNSIMNAWLDPTVLGNFSRTTTMEIRASLTLEDTPLGIPGAVYPSPEDLDVWAEDYPILPGDTLAVEIYELRQRQLPYQAQTVVSPTGHVNLPVIGRVAAAQLTVPEFEDVLRDVLKERDILRDPEVTVDPLLLQYATYSVFGIGVSASSNAPLRAGTFPIRRPDLRVLEAINLVGGLNEFVTDIYIFRYDTPPWAHRQGGPSTGEATPPGGIEREPLSAGSGREETGGDSPSAPEDGRASTRTLEEELIDVVVHGGEGAQEPDTASPPKAVEELLEPDPMQPYIWVNNEFVPNPVYRARSGDVSTLPPAARDTVVPAVNWARIAGDTLFRVIHIPAEQLRAGNPELNIVVRGGDVIRIVSGEIGVYYVMGQVNRVGAFAFNAEPITLKAAIAAAGGLSGLAWPDRCTVYRRIGQREQMIQVDLDRIFAGTDPDFFIRRGDIVNVGTHPFAPFLQRIRGLTLPNPVSNVGYSFTYARNFADIDSFAVRRNPANEPDRFPALFP